MGIVDTFMHCNLQAMAARNPETNYIHYIIEAHPQVLATMRDKNWCNRVSGNVELRVLEGKW